MWLTNALNLVGQVLYPIALAGAIILVAVRGKGPARKLGSAGFIVFAVNWLGQHGLYALASELYSGGDAALTVSYAVIGFGSTLLSLLGFGLLALAVCARPRAAAAGAPVLRDTEV